MGAPAPLTAGPGPRAARRPRPPPPLPTGLPPAVPALPSPLLFLAQPSAEAPPAAGAPGSRATQPVPGVPWGAPGAETCCLLPALGLQGLGPAQATQGLTRCPFAQNWVPDLLMTEGFPEAPKPALSDEDRRSPWTARQAAELAALYPRPTTGGHALVGDPGAHSGDAQSTPILGLCHNDVMGMCWGRPAGACPHGAWTQRPTVPPQPCPGAPRTQEGHCSDRTDLRP